MKSYVLPLLNTVIGHQKDSLAFSKSRLSRCPNHSTTASDKEALQKIPIELQELSDIIKIIGRNLYCIAAFKDGSVKILLYNWARRKKAKILFIGREGRCYSNESKIKKQYEVLQAKSKPSKLRHPR